MILVESSQMRPTRRVFSTERYTGTRGSLRDTTVGARTDPGSEGVHVKAHRYMGRKNQAGRKDERSLDVGKGSCRKMKGI